MISNTVGGETSIKMSANEEIWPTQADARYTGGDRERGDYLALEHIPHLVVVLILMINVISTTSDYDDYMDVDDCEYYYDDSDYSNIN